MKLFKFVLLAIAFGMTALANAATEDTPVEIQRDGAALTDELRVHPDDRDTTNTAIVASNTSPRAGVVVCSAFNANGNFLGAASMRVPQRGLRYLRASDLSNGQDYIGQVRCRSANPSILGSAFLIGPGVLTDLPVKQQSVNGNAHFQVIVTASF